MGMVKNPVKTALSIRLTIISAVVFTLLAACAFQKEAPDPVKVQNEIAEYRSQELVLVRATVSDPQRANRMILLLGERDKLISESIKTINTYRQRMTELNADYHAHRESFETLVASYNRQRAVTQQQFVALIVAMKAETNHEEWQEISEFQMKRLHHRRLTYGQADGEG